MSSDIIERRYHRMKWFAITGWAGFALAVAGAVAFWLLVELPNRRALTEAREELNRTDKAIRELVDVTNRGVERARKQREEVLRLRKR